MVDEQRGFSDSEVMDFVGGYGSGGVATATAAPEAELDDDPGDAPDLAEDATDNGMHVEWSQDGDRVILSISGYFDGDIRAVERGDKTVYVSEHFGGEHTSLKKALDAVARNTASRAVASEWERLNPKTQKPARTRSTNVTADRLDTLEGMLAQLLQQQGVQPATPAAQKPRIARS